MSYDVVIAGGGPAGLSAALILGRARKRVLLCDAGEPRNAAADEVHGFVTQDGTPPREFRRIARQQLAPYESVETRDAGVTAIDGARDAFRVTVGDATVESRRVLLTLGMIDELPDIAGTRELWGTSVFQCPYCHGWEVRDGAFGYLVSEAKWLEFPIFLRGWSRDVVAFTNAQFDVPADAREKLSAAGVPLEERAIRRLVQNGPQLDAVELNDGTRIARDVMFLRTRQRQTPLVERLGLALDEQGFVVVDDHKQTSAPGIHAAGDLTTQAQTAILAAAAGAQAAYMINHALTTGA